MADTSSVLGTAEVPQTRSVPVRHVAAVVVGNALEFYDFLTYGYFAIYIGRTFFPTQSASSPAAAMFRWP